MSDRFCTYRGDREGALVAYLYDDIEPAERRVFESHVATCDMCSTELAGLGVVRARLEQWAPPEPSRALTPQRAPRAADRSPARAAWYDAPTWMQAVAAVLFLGVAAGAANLHITYNQDGLSVRTGWLDAAQAPGSAVAAPEKSVAAPSVAADSVSQADLVALRETLRREIEAAASPNVVRQVRTLVADSERKQENELALRIGTLYRDFQTQRAADMARMGRSLDTLSNNTGLAVQRIQSQVPEYVKSQVRLLQKQ